MLTRALFVAGLASILFAGCSSTPPPAQVGSSAPPASIEGVWHIVADTPSGMHEATMFVEQAGKDMKGRFEGDLGVMHFAGTVATNEVRFSHLAMAGSMRFDYVGQVGPESMQGTAVFGTLGSGQWKASRVKRQ